MFYDRVNQPSTKARKTSDTRFFPAPRRGLIKNESLSMPAGEGAEVLDNIFPTSEGARMRRGSVKHATIGGRATHFAVYDAGVASKLFAANVNNIYDVTSPADPSVIPSAAVSSLTNGDWSSVQFTTSGGEFLIMVNGHDDMQRYDGSSWLAINGASSPSITGVATNDLSYVWKFKSFLMAIEEGTMDMWYFAAGTISGAASVFPLGGVFQNGGSLLFGSTWSLDSGSGLDDVCAFVTTEGEVAVYEGTSPASAATFSLVGVYRIGRPLGKNAHFRAGGDLVIMTDDGLVPLSTVMKTDRSGLQGAALTYPIEEAWRATVRQRKGTQFPFSCVMWHSETMLVVGVPTFSGLPPYCYVSNSRTGSWARYTGWDTRTVTVFDDRLFFGTADGLIVEGEVQGSDRGGVYAGVWVPRFDAFGTPNEKVALHARFLGRSTMTFSPQLFANADYSVDIPTPLPADPDGGGNVWGTAVWGVFTWGDGDDAKQLSSAWQGVAAVGNALSAGVQIQSGRTAAPDLEFIAIHLVFEPGEIMA